MAEDDESGRKDNTDRDHKPKERIRFERAPTGHLGRNRTAAPAPSLGGSGRGGSGRGGGPTFSSPKDEGPRKDGMFVETGDKEVDAFYGKDQTKVSREDAEKMKAREIAKKFAQDRSRNKGWER
ncbi:MAG: hypothetical protein V2I43_05420 [Parvularcula sp.]|jgi:hypothetical protein|nr:hypothetical protein [Parvularcula sp.]